MVLPGIVPQDGGILTQIYMVISIIGFLAFPILLLFGSRIMIWQIDRKVSSVMDYLEAYRNDTKAMFLDNLSSNIGGKTEQKFETLRDFKFSAPTMLDPAGTVGKLENVLDASESKFTRFVEANADTEDPEELANLNMAFKGVMGTHQIYKVLRHYRELLVKTQNFQLVGMIQMVLPIYEELAESQKEATRAFVNGDPIGDAIGPLVAAKFISSEPEEIADDIIRSKEEVAGNEVHVIKSNGPGARLGKYGNAIDEIADEVDAIITVDAGAKFEGEQTGDISEGVGVMMGGPGVEKSKIEEAAVEHDLPLEGIIIKQSPPEASKPMKKEIYEAYKPAVDKVEELVEEIDGTVAVIGVGNTCGIGNQRTEVTNVASSLQKYWDEYEQQEEEDVSYMGLMQVMPGGNAAEMDSALEKFLWKLPRL
ncbi:DUF1512 family protein [Candidatus Nanohalococcus occultus]|uniref:DUF1512 family protein n=1 Tax=Candidatus Nanohalococcus occultus TaxID=2978047 RepID=UPI0039E1FA69